MRKLFLFALLMLGFRVSAAGMMLGAENTTLQYEDLTVHVQVDSESQTITMQLNATFSNEHGNFVWLLPLPSADAEIELGYEESFSPGLSYDIEAPRLLCNQLYYSGNLGSGGTPDSYPQATGFEPFESADSLFEWLEQENYSYPQEAEALIRQYFDEGHPLIAIPIMQESPSGVGHIKPIQIQYHSEDLSFWLPMRLTAFSSGENYNYRMEWIEYHDLFPLNLVIEADSQYAPVNVPHPAFDPQAIEFPHQLQRSRSFSSNWIKLWRETLEANPESFVTLYAGQNEAGRYVTELQAMIAPDAFMIDPVFAPAPDLPDFNYSDYRERDALQFWGCGTRNRIGETVYYEHDYDAGEPIDFTLLDELEKLPENRIHLPRFGQSLAYPADWVHSQFEMQQFSESWGEEIGYLLDVFAPEVVTIEDIEAYQRGEDAPAMIVLSELYIANPGQEYLGSEIISLDSFQRLITSRPDYGWCCRQMIIDLLISEDEWASNQAMYEAILEFPSTWAFSSHANLEHSLYISDWYDEEAGRRIPQFEIGYPEGWIEFYDGESNEIYFLPEGVESHSQAVTIRFFPDGFRSIRGDSSEAELEDYLDEMSDSFNLLPEGRDVLRERILSNNCTPYFPPMALESEGRLGFLIGQITLTAAPDSPITDEQLRMMAESYTFAIHGCG